MKLMKRFWIIAVAGAILLVASACGGESSPAGDEASGPTSVPNPTTTEPVATTAPTPEPADPAAGTDSAPQAASVDIVDLDFEPQEIEIAVGGTVTWENTGEVAHTVTSRSAGFDSGSMSPGDTFTLTPDASGTISYFCQFHSSMQGTIVVSG